MSQQVCSSKSTLYNDRSTQNAYRGFLWVMGLLGFVLPGFICFFVLFYNEVFFLSEGCEVCVEYNIDFFESQKKLTGLQFIFTNCLHSLVPNCPYNGHFTLV